MTDEEKAAYKAANREEVEQMVDAAFLKRFGKTYRTSNPASNGDGLGQIQRDFPSLFGNEP